MFLRFFHRCGHCKALAPAFAEAAKQLKTSDRPVPLAKVDCTVEKETCNAHLVEGYPTLKWFKDGVASDYDGPRDHDGKDFCKLLNGGSQQAFLLLRFIRVRSVRVGLYPI